MWEGHSALLAMDCELIESLPVSRYYPGMEFTVWEPPPRRRDPRSVNPPPVVHFGERLLHGKYGFRLVRDLYAVPNPRPSGRAPRELFTAEQWAATDWAYADVDHTTHSDEYMQSQRESALENYDLNMAFFAQIPRQDFDAALDDVLRKHRQLKPVTDLKKLDGVAGVYVLVLDEYRQAYVGQSGDMRKRIKQHWAGTKPFDRLLWGGVAESVMPIDAFRPLDTTRIFAARTSKGFEMEQKLERAFPADYLLNRIRGGEMTGLRASFIAVEMKRRALVTADVAPSDDTVEDASPVS